MAIYPLILLCALAAALVLTPLVILLARKLRLVDRPGLRKVHAHEVPRVGGIAIVGAFLCGLAPLGLARWAGLADWFGYTGDPRVTVVDPQILAFMGAGIFIFLLGLMDDVFTIRARYKFLGQVVAALAVCNAGIRIDTLAVPVLLEGGVDFGPLSWPITVVWIVGITNAVNLIDGLDGLAAGIGLITTTVVAAISAHFGQLQMLALAMAMAGATGGFLVFNRNPARIFMGDGGSLFLGFMLATGSVLFSCTKGTFVGLALPALALGVPIFDTFFCMLRRFLQRRSPFAPDRNHIHHRMLRRGLTHRATVNLLYLVTLLAAGGGTLAIVMEKEGWVTLGFFGAVTLGLVIFFHAMGSFKFREGLRTLAKRLRVEMSHSRDRREFQDLQLRFMEAENFDQWWRAVQETGRVMDFASITLEMDRRDGSTLQLHWQQDKQPPGRQRGKLQATVPLAQRRRNVPPPSLQVEINLGPDLEAGGRHLATLSRLLDETGLAQLPRPRRNGETWIVKREKVGVPQ